jgi:GNAT superfamily N-acetyltransferase
MMHRAAIHRSGAPRRAHAPNVALLIAHRLKRKRYADGGTADDSDASLNAPWQNPAPAPWPGEDNPYFQSGAATADRLAAAKQAQAYATGRAYWASHPEEQAQREANLNAAANVGLGAASIFAPELLPFVTAGSVYSGARQGAETGDWSDLAYTGAGMAGGSLLGAGLRYGPQVAGALSRYMPGLYRTTDDALHTAMVQDFLGLNPQNFDGAVWRDGSTINVKGQIVDDSGRRVAHIDRAIDPAAGTSEHHIFEVEPEFQGRGLSRRLLGNHLDWYLNNGVDRIGANSNIDNGAYTWARAGFVPSNAEEWNNLKPILANRLDALQQSGRISDDAATEISRFIQSDNPKAIWGVADFKAPVGGSEHPLGKHLLLGRGIGYDSVLDLNDPQAFARIKNYVR